MQEFIEVKDLSYDTIYDFAAKATELPKSSGKAALFLLGKAAAYVDVAFALEIIPMADCFDLLCYIEEFQAEIAL